MYVLFLEHFTVYFVLLFTHNKTDTNTMKWIASRRKTIFALLTMAGAVAFGSWRRIFMKSEKSKQMLKDTKTKMFASVEQAINGIVIEVTKTG